MLPNAKKIPNPGVLAGDGREGDDPRERRGEACPCENQPDHRREPLRVEFAYAGKTLANGGGEAPAARWLRFHPPVEFDGDRRAVDFGQLDANSLARAIPVGQVHNPHPICARRNCGVVPNSPGRRRFRPCR